MEKKKPEALSEQELANVSGGKDDKKYYAGDAVDFEATVPTNRGVPTTYNMTGIITAINGNMYSIEVEGTIFEVTEDCIHGIATVKTEGGACGGWN